MSIVREGGVRKKRKGELKGKMMIMMMMREEREGARNE